ncbi:MAG: hypothetical protein A3B74_04885 [Candidatus Kerfeldbacteria bacterium RIFCSPHIGHO2_02_FULL_42_14]|uniref:Uncharacterized protein n=1 Tax=Candidatus Kerfeldbacteria bacterium RIFCSPHIGHO2_02_FULL_42_14 TaxID=1798540 RepID=A0A1G2ARM8_9BACT|nr:MAG: hypothetical protein A3B74_04885 [Candidatus Kerfeldbacteria bacterium RIFCSPHIGHO2_02_FULL_42_14]OGY81056.1 MAG: hypothetical protein A3E60_03605 [Candidatus Kerfeldbacteria bacterium RIFCSPHIGHO2_12_FULL_42_13]OGY84874.1 MAG: hypothetical protein A3I91_05250 [Candidatus Kerfeldbacteria bacterium RIFCSPLOWO2_02_FULL_42_19]OGY86787.1 MAG: hypothetical protein A3G01_02550 [Candidatus Kerfeldbacteria bacterium RIFCSPLOWO2_12_FULL_43_9]
MNNSKENSQEHNSFDSPEAVRDEFVQLLNEYIDDLEQDRSSHVFEKLAVLPVSEIEKKEFLELLQTARTFGLRKERMQVSRDFAEHGLQEMLVKIPKKPAVKKERKWNHTVLFFGAVSATVALFAIALVKNTYQHFGTTVNQIVRYIYVENTSQNAGEETTKEKSEGIENANQNIEQPKEAAENKAERKEGEENEEIKQPETPKTEEQTQNQTEDQTNVHNAENNEAEQETEQEQQREPSKNTNTTVRTAGVDENFLILSADVTKQIEQFEATTTAWQMLEDAAALEPYIQDIKSLDSGDE